MKKTIMKRTEPNVRLREKLIKKAFKLFKQKSKPIELPYIIKPGTYREILNHSWNTDIEVKRNILLWCENPEKSALEQLIALTKLPLIQFDVLGMADLHEGYGMPIGGVIATDDIILPYCVGNDIGCGMFATKLSCKHITSNQVSQIMEITEKTIPYGKGVGHKQQQKWDGFDKAPEFPTYIKSVLETARFQLGSLGAGNHFIELLKGNDSHLWLMIHSGSRKLGASICTEFYHRAKTFCSENGHSVPSPHLSFLPLYTDDGKWYFQMMNFALDYAKENRRRMMTIFESIVCSILNCDVEQEIDIHHNYAKFETHNDKAVLIHRKGATPAFNSQLGIIPGSMGTSSYIVKGKGSEKSLCTVSHGAGRAMSRRKAKIKFKKSETQSLLKGIWFNKIVLDEDPRCYKDIHQIIAAQRDLVESIVRLDPLGVIIG